MQIELQKITQYAKGVNVYIDGDRAAYLVGDDGFKEICAEWNNMIDGAHQMPAYGVSLNGETVKAINSGVWLEFIFDRVYESGGMPFEKLLINVREGDMGFNLIRYNAAYGYDGRCFYFDLNGKDMSGLYNFLIK